MISRRSFWSILPSICCFGFSSKKEVISQKKMDPEAYKAYRAFTACLIVSDLRRKNIIREDADIDFAKESVDNYLKILSKCKT